MCQLYWTFCICCKKQMGQWKMPVYCNKERIHRDGLGNVDNCPTDGPCQECLLFGHEEPCCNKTMPTHFTRWKRRDGTFYVKYKK